MSFSLEVHQNEYLSEDARQVDAVITVASAGGQRVAATADKAVVLVVDASGSMDFPVATRGSERSRTTKILEARRAAATAIDQLPDDTLFALVAGNHDAYLVYPSSGEPLARASARTRAEAVEATRRLRPSGGTAISTWIDMVRTLLEPRAGAIRLAYLLTDGKNESESPRALDAALARATDVFQCDTRGVGDDWVEAEVQRISSALLGEPGIIKSPEEMEADFCAYMARAIGKTIPDVRLRVWTPAGSTTRFLRQAHPAIEDLTDKARVDPPDGAEGSLGPSTGPLTSDYPTGAWAGDESRDYHLCVDVPPGDVGDEKLAARISLIVGEEAAGQGLVRAVWTDDVELSTKLNPEVAFYTGRAEQAAAIQEGMQYLKEGDSERATVKLGHAVQLAEAAGDEATLRLLRNVVDIDDPAKGTVRVKHDVRKVDAMEVVIGSSRTVLLQTPARPAEREEGS